MAPRDHGWWFATRSDESRSSKLPHSGYRTYRLYVRQSQISIRKENLANLFDPILDDEERMMTSSLFRVAPKPRQLLIVGSMFWYFLICCVLYIAVVSSASVSNDDSTTALGINENVCVEIGGGGGGTEYTCTTNPLGVRQFIDAQKQKHQQEVRLPGVNSIIRGGSSSFSRGVAQRVDGSESEKKAIQEVLKLMNDYFNNEVLALPEYASVRDKW